jgi:alanine dehydrogenase
VPPTRLLARHDVERLLDLPACIDAVEHAFRLRGQGRAGEAGVLALHAADGALHAKGAVLDLGRPWIVCKLNSNFPGNPARGALPTIQGVLALFDAADGRPVAVMDSAALTALRTAAATAVAARHLARPGAEAVAVVGCGAQALAQLAALCAVLPVRRAAAHDLDADAARAFAADAGRRLGIPVAPAAGLAEATRGADVVVTCTTARRPFLGARHLAPGAFVAAVGADSEAKSELEPALLAAAAVVTDSTPQCAAIGDLHHAIDAGAMRASDVRAELGDVVADPSRGRRADDGIVVFDSTGIAIQDVAAAVLVYERAEREGGGVTFDFRG